MYLIFWFANWFFWLRHIYIYIYYARIIWVYIWVRWGNKSNRWRALRWLIIYRRIPSLDQWWKPSGSLRTHLHVPLRCDNRIHWSWFPSSTSTVFFSSLRHYRTYSEITSIKIWKISNSDISKCKLSPTFLHDFRCSGLLKWTKSSKLTWNVIDIYKKYLCIDDHEPLPTFSGFCLCTLLSLFQKII